VIFKRGKKEERHKLPLNLTLFSYSSSSVGSVLDLLQSRFRDASIPPIDFE
jgi:hypothetical protein